jgi:hypothetical protein
VGFVLAAALARRIVPEPWASAGALLVGLSAPALAYGGAVDPALGAGALLAGGALCALAVRERARAAHALGGAALLALLPWLGVRYAVAGLPVAVALVAWTQHARRRVLALATAEVMLASVVAYVTVQERLHGGLTPLATGARTPLDHLERVPRLAALWLDRDVGLLRWAPVLALAVFAGWLLWRSRREHVARAVPARAGAEDAGALLLTVCGAQVLVAAFGTPALAGDWFPGRGLVPALPCAAALAAWGLRHAPRAGAALGALTLAASGWVLAGLGTGSIEAWPDVPASRAPLGPLVALLPRLPDGSSGAWVAAAALAAAAAGLVAREWRTRPAAALRRS